MFEKYRPCCNAYLITPYDPGRKVIARMVDFETKDYHRNTCMMVYKYNPLLASQYNIVLPLVDIYFNGMLLKARIYYFDYMTWINDGDPPTVELA